MRYTQENFKKVSDAPVSFIRNAGAFVEEMFTDEDLRWLLCSALEGGYSPWMRIGDSLHAVSQEGTNRVRGEQTGDFDWSTACVAPFDNGNALLIEEWGDEDKCVATYELTRDSMIRGLAAMTVLAPDQFAAILTDGADSITGDVFLQLATIGERRYG